MGDRAARFQRTVLRCGLLFFTLWLTGCLLIGVARLARQHDPSQLDITYRFEAYRYSDSSLWETDDLEYGEWPQLEYYIDDELVPDGDIVITENTIVVARPASGYVFAPSIDDDWYYPYTP